VIFAAGIRPNIALAKSAGIPVGRGIVVDDCLQTGAPDIFALGECRRASRHLLWLVEPAYEQARVLARHLAGCAAAYSGSVVATNLKVSGVSVFSAGDFIGAEGSESHCPQRCQARHLQETGDSGWTSCRRGAGWDAGCAVVPRIDPQPRADRPDFATA